MAVQELRPMGIGDILDVMFRLYRRRFLTFLLIALIVYVPYALLLALAPTAAAGVPAAANPLSFVLGIAGFAMFAIVLLPLCGAALVHNISASYLGENLTAAESYKRATPRLLGLLGTQLLSIIVIMIGYFLLIIPGIIFSLWFLVVVPVVMLEGRYGTGALGRSRELMQGNISKGFTLGLVVGILSFIIGMVLGQAAALVPWPHPAIRTFFVNLLPALLLPIQTAPWILLYYDLRIRKEAFDLQMLSQALAQPAVNPAPPT